MYTTNPLLRVIGVAILLLVGLNARADGVSDQNSAPTAPPERTDAGIPSSTPDAPVPLAKDAPQSVAPAPMPVFPTTADSGLELVTERYANGAVKIERHVLASINRQPCGPW
jgi:hypothetical protein